MKMDYETMFNKKGGQDSSSEEEENIPVKN